jgi:hypothetical protein
MNRILIPLLLVALLNSAARAQTCYGGFCYPAQPSARLVTPIDAQSPVTNHQSLSPHCRIQVGDGSVGSGTLVSKGDSTATVLTCSHLFDNSTSSIIVTFSDGTRFGARLIERDRANDLAALLIRVPAVSPIEVDDAQPTGVLTACGYGNDGRFRGVRGAITGTAQAVGATFPSMQIGGAVRPGDSGGGVLNTTGQLVGVVWGCRDGETYLTCGPPLRDFLSRVLPSIARREPERPRPRSSTPTLDSELWRTEIEQRLTALDAKKQDRGDYLQASDLNAYVQRDEVSQVVSSESEQIEQRATSRIESLHTAILARVEERMNQVNPGLLGGLSTGKLVVGALGLSGPVALAVMVAGTFAGYRFKQRAQKSTNSQPSTLNSRPTQPIAVDTPPPPQRSVPESHYVPVERDDFARAHQWAREQVARKYPGATEILTTLESLIKQQLAGN